MDEDYIQTNIMNETSKLDTERRRRGDFERYLKGYGIDIGCGNDILKTNDGAVDPWDMAQGDAQTMEGLEPNTYDFVYSSHCLEHLDSPAHALRRWLEILKPGGFLYLVVPDWELYEHRIWPSPNPAHKFSFSMSDPQPGRTNHFYMPEFIYVFRDKMKLREMRLEDYGFDYSLLSAPIDQTMMGAACQICFIAQKI